MKEEKYFNDLINILQSLPSVGKKSATRLAYFLAVENKFAALRVAQSIQDAVTHIHQCLECGGVSEDELCSICADSGRHNGELCIVQHPKDILVLEESNFFKGCYFVLQENNDFAVEKLKKIIRQHHIQEIIFAFSPSLASDTLALWLEDKLKDCSLLFTRIAQGVPSGVSFENIDQISLWKAFETRTKI
ncbi:recombination protein RecR [Helicobacter monodelphidis]|uniref:recombination mediator RecR n=1 Tax=Helicobacter sp. 15-1451 TaxID=2004995 RepID=UPI000DCF2A0E|nr:recombination mediator RecR [Helicobacter sp. 15-1451]RAX58223.1 recombination protein RecR [Helicobacter sp. 15-1451]